MRYQFTPIRMAIIKKSANNKCWRECRQKGVTATMETKYGSSLKKLKIELPYDQEQFCSSI